MMKNAIGLVLVLFLLLSDFGYAGSATWNLNPASGDWNTAANWTPATVPNDESDVATFGVSTVTDITPSDVITLREIVFEAGANAYSFTIDSDRTLELVGEGITNDSGVVQSFVVEASNTKSGSSEGLLFSGNATAGSMTSFTTLGRAGFITFTDDTSAGSATFTNTVSKPGSQGGLVEFSGRSVRRPSVYK